MIKKIIQWICRVVILILIAAGLFFFFVIKPQWDAHERVRAMPIQDVDMSTVADGIYRGEFTYSGTGVLVEVTVRKDSIRHIEILKGAATTHGLPAEKIVHHIVKANALSVDVITGATTTSKALLKAVEKALKKGQKSASVVY